MMPRGVYKKSEEHKRKLSEARRGKKTGPITEEARASLSASWTPERRKAESERKTGKRHSQETKDKIAAASKANMTEEARQHLSEWNAQYWTDERREEHSRRGRNGVAPLGFSYDSDGYKILTGQRGHPLATTRRSYTVKEHRKVLYDAIGPGPHACHWSAVSGCGATELDWDDIHVDHLNGDVVDNRIENLVVSCPLCNVRRGRAGNPIDWSGGGK